MVFAALNSKVGYIKNFELNNPQFSNDDLSTAQTANHCTLELTVLTLYLFALIYEGAKKHFSKKEIGKALVQFKYFSMNK